MPKSFFENRVRELTQRRAEHRAALQQLDLELGWWQQGLELFGDSDTDDLEEVIPSTDAAGSNNGTIRELQPPSEVFSHSGAKPTLRQAIVAVMSEDGDLERSWRPADVRAALQRRGWMPEAKSGPQMVRNRLGTMHSEGDLDKDDNGYRFAAEARNTGLIQLGPE